ncbi:MAG: YwbE family protein [Spirochaetaceae bacterium]|nr:MAG: YwbE family protein [Spirochaetaceae bacterium]
MSPCRAAGQFTTAYCKAQAGSTPRDQRSGATTVGVVERILTNSAFHPHGIKVRLVSGEVGRIKQIHL